MEERTERILWIDELRGFAICVMILHHIAFNSIYFLELPIAWLSSFLESGAFRALHLLFLAVFLGLSGVCSHFSCHPYKRAGRVFLAALAVTAVTCIAYPEEAIWFGILHLLAFSMLLAAALGKYGKKVSPVWGITLSLLLFMLTYRVPDGFLLSFPLPAALYQSEFLVPLGFAPVSFASLDYDPILPYFFLFAAGFFLGNLRLPKGGGRFSFFGFCGRHSLLVYLLHQPVVFGLFFLLTKIFVR